MPRAIWSGSITFGLVSLPVKAYTATSRQRVDFDLLHDEDGAKIEYRRVCSVEGEVVPWEHIIKGYEVSPGRYVTFTKEELEALQPAATHTIDIEDFVHLDEIDPMYFDTPYYLTPEPGARRAYELLSGVMKDAGVIAIARVVLRSRERLVAVRPLADGTLMMETLHYATELREPPDVDAGSGRAQSEPTERERTMARRLVDELTVPFEPESYTDTWHEHILERIERKAEGKVIEAPTKDEPEATPMGDIVAALEQSLAAARSKGGATKKSPAAAASTRRTASTRRAASTRRPSSKSKSR